MSHILCKNFSIGNAAGICKSVDLVDQLTRSGLTEITVGSITTLPRSGNTPGVVHHQSQSGASINALGMPNLGLEQYREVLPIMSQITHNAGKLLSISIAPQADGDLEILLRACIQAGVDIIEVNGGCPNIWNDSGEQKRILSFHARGLDTALQTCLEQKSILGWKGELRVKLSPYSDPGLLAEVAEVISDLGGEKNKITVVTCNTFPNALMFNWTDRHSRPALTFGSGYGGYSGSGYLPIALGQVAQFRKHLGDSHKIIGVGGISLGSHIIEHASVGANGIQIGSSLYYADYPAKAVDNILQELSSFL